MWIQDPKALIQKQLSNPELMDFIDYTPHQVFGHNYQQVWTDFITGNLAWEQCNKLSKDPENHGAMFVPIILGSDKTTVSVATGNNEYWPIYISTGNVHNCAYCGHGQAMSLLGFLSIPKAMLKPEVTLCADGHYQRAIYGIGPYIADHPEQALLACIVQGWCPNVQIWIARRILVHIITNTLGC
ncbi:hypothetical protein V8B97DRAFT_1913930 [Scleroderma yunnanense]